MKIRIKFSKEGAMKFVGHLDMMRYFQKAMRRANVDIRYSGGFSPHMVMSFASPLGVGVTSSGEYMDIEVLSTDPSVEMLKRLNQVMVPGVEVLSYRRLPDTAKDAMSIVAAADYLVRFREGYGPQRWEDFASGWPGFLNQGSIFVHKKTKKGEKVMDIRPWIYGWDGKEGEIHLRLATGSMANLKPETAIGAYLESRGSQLGEFALLIHRNEVYANQAKAGKPDFCPLEQFGEDIE